VKAARIARDPLNWETVGGLTNQEKKALGEERDLGFWRQPKTLRVTIATLCIAAIIQGWTQTGANGANQSWPAEFGLTDPKTGQIAKGKSTWIFAGVNAVTYLAASLFGCWLSDPLQSMILGRRGAIFVSGCLCLASVIGAGCSHSWRQLLGCRAVLGLGMGAKASVTPIYGAEVSPSHLR
jgi:MFS family permease